MSEIAELQGRPAPEGKLILHCTTTPVIDWISFGEKNQHAFDLDLMYFGEDGKPVFMPPANEPVPSTYHPYSPSSRQVLAPVPPVAYDTFIDTFE